MPFSPSFSCPKRKRKGPAVPMRRPPAGTAAFCLSSYAAKSCAARCKKQHEALVPLSPGREKRPMVGVMDLAPLRCGHLPTAYSGPGGLSKENFLNDAPGKPPLCKGRCRAAAEGLVSWRDCPFTDYNRGFTTPQSASLTAPLTQGSQSLLPQAPACPRTSNFFS